MKNDISSRRRSLRFESLESRALLAADLLLPHNFAMPEDCNDSGTVSPLDALIVINELNRPEAGSAIDSAKMLDVNADGHLSPLDALVVINYLNRQPSNGNSIPSHVPIETRIARLESAIANGQLPIALGADGAQELLQTLKSGGRPELGERFIEGRVHSRNEVEQFETERIVSELAPPVRDADYANRVAEFLERFSAKLNAAGINAQAIETITSEIKLGIDTGTPLTLAQIKTRLAELGVDVSMLFPVRPAVPPTTGTTALPPLHFQPTTPQRWSPSVELVTGILRRANANPESIERVRAAMIAAKDSGSPLNAPQILSLLGRTGIQVVPSIARFLQPLR